MDNGLEDSHITYYCSLIISLIVGVSIFILDCNKYLSYCSLSKYMSLLLHFVVYCTYVGIIHIGIIHIRRYHNTLPLILDRGHKSLQDNSYTTCY